MRRRGGNGKEREELSVNVPSFFRCPISMDVMRSPVSLCTGVTYDRSSIQTWIDTGHNTCPATMQVLPTTDFVPNHNLHRLIQLWAAQSRHHQQQQQQRQQKQKQAPLPDAAGVPTSSQELIRGLPSSADPLPLLRKLAEDMDDAARIRKLAENAGCVPALSSVLLRKDLGLEEMETAARVLSAVLLTRKEGGAEIGRSPSDPLILPSLVGVLKRGSLESRIAAARVVESVALAGTESKLQIAETEGMLAELLLLASDQEEGKPADPMAVDAGLSSLVAVSSLRRVRPQIAGLGAIPTLGKLLARPSTSPAAAEKALKLMEAASTCTEGRAAICEDSATVGALVRRMMKVPAESAEHAVAVLWSVCHQFRDRRAQEAVAVGDGLTKILLLMQSNCSPAARRMAGDLLKTLRVNSKSCLPSYDSKTTHIAPF